MIGADASGLARTLVLEGGSDQGFEAGMAVLSTEGVVGKLIAVGPSSSRVLLINDHNSALDAFDQRSRMRGIVAGMVDDGLVMKYVDRSRGREERGYNSHVGPGRDFPARPAGGRSHDGACARVRDCS